MALRVVWFLLLSMFVSLNQGTHAQTLHTLIVVTSLSPLASRSNIYNSVRLAIDNTLLSDCASSAPMDIVFAIATNCNASQLSAIKSFLTQLVDGGFFTRNTHIGFVLFSDATISTQPAQSWMNNTNASLHRTTPSTSDTPDLCAFAARHIELACLLSNNTSTSRWFEADMKHTLCVDASTTPAESMAHAQHAASRVPGHNPTATQIQTRLTRAMHTYLAMVRVDEVAYHGDDSDVHFSLTKPATLVRGCAVVLALGAALGAAVECAGRGSDGRRRARRVPWQ